MGNLYMYINHQWLIYGESIYQSSILESHWNSWPSWQPILLGKAPLRTLRVGPDRPQGRWISESHWFQRQTKRNSGVTSHHSWVEVQTSKNKKTCGFSAGGFLNFWSSKLGNTPGFQGFPNGTGGLLALHGGVVLSLARGMGCGLGENSPRKPHWWMDIFNKKNVV